MPSSNQPYEAAAEESVANTDEIMISVGDDDDGGSLVDDLMPPSSTTVTTAADTVVAKQGHDINEQQQQQQQEEVVDMNTVDVATSHNNTVTVTTATTTTDHHDMLLTTTTTTTTANHPDNDSTLPQLPPPPHDDHLLPSVPAIPTTHHPEVALEAVLHNPPHTLQQQQQQMMMTIRPSPEANSTSTHHHAPKPKRINWGKSPHRERLTQILNDWFTKSGMCIDPTTNVPYTDYRVYAERVGISRTTLFKYIHKDVSKRRMIPVGEGVRGKKRLLSEVEIGEIVRELRVGRDDNTPPSRNEGVDLIVKRFGLSRQAASRQLTRHVLPLFEQPPQQLGGVAVSTTATAVVGGDNGGGGKQPATVDTLTAIGQQPPPPDQLLQDPQQQPFANPITTTQPENNITTTITKRSIVISGVTSGLGRALLGYYYHQGHTIAGCGRRSSEIDALQLMYPNAKLSVVDVACDDAVRDWAVSIFGSGDTSGVVVNGAEPSKAVVVDLVIANAGISPETIHQTKCAWEVPRHEFDATIDVNVKGVSNMIRHFVPRMLSNSTSPTTTTRHGGTFVAMSSGLGRSPNPHHAAYCASKWAVEGMVKSLAMSFPVESGMCAVPLAPGIVQTDHSHGGGGNKYGMEASLNTGSKNLEEWVKVAGPMILGLSRKDNGKSLSVKGFYSLRYRQSWSFPDGSGIPDQVGHMV